MSEFEVWGYPCEDRDMDVALADEVRGKAHNRSFRLPWGQELLRRHDHGEWRKEEPQWLIQCDRGHWHEGQHRAYVVQCTGQPMRVIVMRGVPCEVADRLGMALPKTNADWMSYSMGLPNARNLAATTTLMHFHDALLSQDITNIVSAKASPEALQRTLQRHPTLIDDMSEAARLRSSLGHGSQAAMAVMICLCREHDAVVADDYIEALRTGESLTRGDPALAVREFYRRKRSRSSMSRKEQVVQLAILLRGYQRRYHRERWVNAVWSGKVFPKVRDI